LLGEGIVVALNLDRRRQTGFIMLQVANATNYGKVGERENEGRKQLIRSGDDGWPRASMQVKDRKKDLQMEYHNV
jgi:hypothetical protein